MPDQPTVHILLATYNGAKYLQAQLDSIARQTHAQWTLTVSDDGSTDETINIVKAFAQNTQQPVTLLQGPGMGSSTRNFCHLIQHSPAENELDLYAFCDQDDVWLDNKLQQAVHWHSQSPHSSARLYCGCTQFVNDQLRPIGLSPVIRHPPSFGNALVQNIASGNTMVFSHAVLMAQKKIQPEHSVWHDWSTYLVTTALGGVVHFDYWPSLLYRQHEGNVIGANDNLTKLVKSITLSIRGRYQCRISKNLLALHDLALNESEKVIEQLSLINQIRSRRNPLKRIWLLKRSKLRRQGRLSNIGLWIACLLGKL